MNPKAEQGGPDSIRMAQVEAGERAVVERLRAKGLLEPEQALEILSYNPTEEEAEAALQACGTSGKEVVNEFIERLLRENSDLRDRHAKVVEALQYYAAAYHDDHHCHVISPVEFDRCDTKRCVKARTLIDAALNPNNVGETS